MSTALAPAADPDPDRHPGLTCRLLERLQDVPGFVGRSAARKYRRRMYPFALREMDRRLALMTPGDICIDLGANVGTFTEIMAASGAQVHAFEPDPRTFERLVARVGHLANVTLHNKAVGTVAGNLPLYRAADFDENFESASQATSLHYTSGRMQPVAGLTVEVVAFSDLLAGLGPVRLIKMDIEGAEWAVLDQIFASPKALAFDALFVETHERLEPARYRQVVAMRRAARAMDRPYVNLYWP